MLLFAPAGRPLSFVVARSEQRPEIVRVIEVGIQFQFVGIGREGS